jgi:hypothetical protein
MQRFEICITKELEKETKIPVLTTKPKQTKK